MKKVLIIDDEERIRQLYCRLLIDEGFQVTSASNVYDAAANISEGDVDLVLLDIRLPQVDGSRLYRLIQKQSPQIKVIVASVYSVDDQRIFIPDADDYFDKSQGTEKLVNKVRRAFQSKKKEKVIQIN